MISDLNPDFDNGRHVQTLPDFFQEQALLITDAKMSETITSENWKRATNKIIYSHLSENLSPSKIELESGLDLCDIWRRIWYPCLNSQEREILFLLVHMKLPVQERLFRIQVAKDPYCVTCMDKSGALLCDFEHFFCSCERVEAAWNAIKVILMKLISQSSATISIENLDLISLRFRRTCNENEIVWLLSSYLHRVWNMLFREGKQLVEKGRMFGYLRFKYKVDQLGARVHLRNIPGLLSGD